MLAGWIGVFKRWIGFRAGRRVNPPRLTLPRSEVRGDSGLTGSRVRVRVGVRICSGNLPEYTSLDLQNLSEV